MTYGAAALLLKPKQSKEIEFDWRYGYDSLASGKYRVITSVFLSTDTPINKDNMQLSFADLEYANRKRTTRKDKFLKEINEDFSTETS